MSEFLDVALAAAKAAEKIILQHYEAGVDVTLKDDYSPVTVADVDTEKAIKEIILKAFPEHGFFGEETGKVNEDAEYNWLIDPIDGTKSFVRRYPFFSTQIALMKGDELIVGVSNAPLFKQLAYAEKGNGAYLNDEKITVSDIIEMRDVSLSSGNIASLAGHPEAWKHYGELCQEVNRTRGYGDFYHYHLLASGSIDLIVEADVNILDIAALSVIVNEAGGHFTDLKGKGLNLQTTSVLAANSKDLHQHVLQKLAY